MRYGSRQAGRFAKSDMTPMIDMTFQLIAFFMVVINFSAANQDERIRLPLSELAKPPEAPSEASITLQLTEDGSVLLGADPVPLAELPERLLFQKQLLAARNEQLARETTIIIRADKKAPTGDVQKIMEICQEKPLLFEKFVLRAKQAST
jgi:biopolymer transport protein ExbD